MGCLTMRHKKHIFAMVLLCAVSLNSCAYVLIGGAAAIGGYAVSQDTIQGEIKRSYDQVWSAAVDIVGIMGTISTQSADLGKITALVNGARVTVNIMQLTDTVVRLRVKARKTFVPSSVKDQVFVKIMERLNKEE